MMIRTTIVNDCTNANNSNVDRDSEGDIPVTQFSLYHQSSMTNYCGCWERPRYV